MTTVERPVASPCVNICALDEDDVCTGCQRTVAEITRWGRMSNDERRVVLGLCHERAKASGLVPSIGFLLNMDWGVMKMNFMPDAELGPHLKGLEGFIRQQIVDRDSLVYTLARHHYIRMAIGCVIEADEESPEMVPFLFQFASSLNALTFFYDRLYDFSGEALASAREEYEEE